MADIDQFIKTLDNQMVLDTDSSVLVDDIIPGKPLIISFAFYVYNTVPGFDFYGRLKKLQKLTGNNFNLVLVRDKKNLWYQTGIEGLGRNIAETVEGLKAIIDRIKPSSVITIGQSMGAYAAIQYGALLGADKSIAFGPLSFLDVKKAEEIDDKRWLLPMQELEKLRPENCVYDLPEFLKQQKKLPEIDIIYGGMEQEEHYANPDNYHAQRIRINDSIRLNKFDDSPHAVVQYLIDNKLIDRLLCKLILDEDLDESKAAEIEDEPMYVKGLTPEWSKWILENLVKGATPEVIQEVLQESIPEMTPDEIKKSIADIMQSPFMPVCQNLQNDLKKREWVLSTLDAHNREKNKYLQSFIHEIVPNYKTFQEKFYYENIPGLFRGAVSDWPAMKWTPQNLKDKVGNPEIEVQHGRSKDPRYEENGFKYKTQMKFHDFVDQVLSVESSNDMYLTANNAAASNAKLGAMFSDLRNIGDGYMDMDKLAKQGFMWLGPKGTYTPAHHDLTNNIFVQIYGHKRFWLLPSSQVPYIYNANHVYSPVDMRKPDYNAYPDMAKATVYQFDVGPGDFLFIPIGWWHSVESLSVSISFSTNAFADQHNQYHATYPSNNQRY